MELAQPSFKKIRLIKRRLKSCRVWLLLKEKLKSLRMTKGRDKNGITLLAGPTNIIREIQHINWVWLKCTLRYYFVISLYWKLLWLFVTYLMIKMITFPWKYGHFNFYRVVNAIDSFCGVILVGCVSYTVMIFKQL